MKVHFFSPELCTVIVKTQKNSQIYDSMVFLHVYLDARKISQEVPETTCTVNETKIHTELQNA